MNDPLHMQLLNYAETTLLFSDRYVHYVYMCVHVCPLYTVYVTSSIVNPYCRGVDCNIISWNRVILLHGEWGRESSTAW